MPPQENYNKHTEGISDRNNELHRISEQLEEIKHIMDERGSNIADATPVVSTGSVPLRGVSTAILLVAVQGGLACRNLEGCYAS